MAKTLKCKECGEEVEVKDRQLSVVCVDCAERDMMERELEEDFRKRPPQPDFGEFMHGTLVADPRFRKGYLHHRAMAHADDERKRG